MVFEEGPYIQAACFCDIALRDDTGTFSLIRMVDTITQEARGIDLPEDMPPVTFNLKLALMLKAGKAQGRSTIKIVPEFPSGETGNAITITAHFEGEEKGYNAVVNLNYTFPFEGLYWFRVYVDNHKFTAIPLRVKYNRTVVQ